MLWTTMQVWSILADISVFMVLNIQIFLIYGIVGWYFFGDTAPQYSTLLGAMRGVTDFVVAHDSLS